MGTECVLPGRPLPAFCAHDSFFAKSTLRLDILQLEFFSNYGLPFQDLGVTALLADYMPSLEVFNRQILTAASNIIIYTQH